MGSVVFCQLLLIGSDTAPTHKPIVSTEVDNGQVQADLQTISRECFSMRHGAAG